VIERFLPVKITMTVERDGSAVISVDVEPNAKLVSAQLPAHPDT
jgi:hypothetical protein